MDSIDGVYVDGTFQFRGIRVKEVSLERGLISVTEENTKMVSDGLESNEYIYYKKGSGICYEDDCVIGNTMFDAFRALNNLEWVHSHKFYLVIEEK